MELIRGIHNLRSKHQGCVLTIGKFDGMHLGHRAVISRLIEKARELGLPASVMVFEPQPEEVFAPERAPARLSRLRDKYLALQEMGVDRLICVKFDRNFASMSAEAFVEDLLVAKLGIRFLVVGDDFRFGKGRAGDFAKLQQEGEKCDFEVVSTQSFRLKDCRISSTAIREALASGDLQTAEEMLGRPYSIAGKVVHGEKKGRTIGFPTANVLLQRLINPIQGVFAVTVDVDGKCYSGVANIGKRPTLGGERAQLEVHLFDFKDNLYGRFINVAVKQKIREEKRFDSFAQLKEQIERDALAAKRLFASTT